MIRILVTGADGQVGTEITRLSNEQAIPVISTDIKELDITQADKTENFLENIKPELVINASAYTAVDKAEQESEVSYAVNRDGPANLARACKNAGIPLLHISTDYVFNGMQDSPYLETDNPNPTGVYGRSKLEGETAVQVTLQQHIILRTSWVFSATGQNFPRTMLRQAQNKDELRIVSDQYGGPTWAGDIARVLLNLASRYLDGQSLNWGLYHYSGTPATNWYEFAKTIFNHAKKLNLIEDIPNMIAITTDDYPTPAQRPQNSVLDCTKIKKIFTFEQPDWHTGLQTVLAEWKIA
jgi:dTDP-4-dehydrorhamnose reductase